MDDGRPRHAGRGGGAAAGADGDGGARERRPRARSRRSPGPGRSSASGIATPAPRRRKAAFAAGARVVTHLFNAMSQLGNREPGLVGAALDAEGVAAGLIADGIHVAPESMRAALAAKRGEDGIFLVTDAMPVAGTDLDGFELNGRRILRRDGRLTLEDGTLAGADIDFPGAIRVLVREGVPLARALRMATVAPARVLGRGRPRPAGAGAGGGLRASRRAAGASRRVAGGQGSLSGFPVDRPGPAMLVEEELRRQAVLARSSPRRACRCCRCRTRRSAGRAPSPARARRNGRRTRTRRAATARGRTARPRLPPARRRRGPSPASRARGRARSRSGGRPPRRHAPARA